MFDAARIAVLESHTPFCNLKDQIIDTKMRVLVQDGDVCIKDKYHSYVMNQLTARKKEKLLERQPYRRATKPPMVNI